MWGITKEEQDKCFRLLLKEVTEKKNIKHRMLMRMNERGERVAEVGTAEP